MDAQGALLHTGVTEVQTKGWAYRMRDQAKAILAEVQGAPAPNPLAIFTTEQLVAELMRRQEHSGAEPMLSRTVNDGN
jgi:hypothetical protein